MADQVLLWSIRCTMPIRSTLVDQVHFDRSSPLWPISSTLADQVHVGRSGPLRPIQSTLPDRAHFGRSSPLRPTRSTLADQVHFGRSSPLGSGRLGRPISRPVLVMQDCPIGSTLHQVYFSIQIRLTLCMDMHRQTLVYILPLTASARMFHIK